jgi:hypothetical protein
MPATPYRAHARECSRGLAGTTQATREGSGRWACRQTRPLRKAAARSARRAPAAGTGVAVAAAAAVAGAEAVLFVPCAGWLGPRHLWQLRLLLRAGSMTVRVRCTGDQRKQAIHYYDTFYLALSI